MMKNNKTWRERKEDYIKFMYGKAYRKYAEADPHDDRRLYMNMYDQIMEAVQSVPADPVPFVAVAMNNEMEKSFKTMDRIQEHFKGKETE